MLGHLPQVDPVSLGDGEARDLVQRTTQSVAAEEDRVSAGSCVDVIGPAAAVDRVVAVGSEDAVTRIAADHALCRLQDHRFAAESASRQPDFRLQERGQGGGVFRIGLFGEVDLIGGQPVHADRVVEQENVWVGRRARPDRGDDAGLVGPVAGIADDRAAIDGRIAVVQVVCEDFGNARPEFRRQGRDHEVRLRAVRHGEELVDRLAEVAHDRREPVSEERGFVLVEIVGAGHEQDDIRREGVEIVGQVHGARKTIVPDDIP